MTDINIIEPARMLARLGSLTQEINEFNKQFSFGRSLAGVFASLISPGDHAGEKVVEVALEPTNVAEQIQDRYSRLLYQAGLELEINRGQSESEQLKHDSGVCDALSAGRVIKVHRLDLQVIDADRLCRFFSGLKTNDLTRESDQAILGVLADSLRDSIYQHHLNNLVGFSSVRSDAFTDVALEINSEFSRLGFKEESRDLGKVVEHLISGTLSEYLLAKNANILPAEGFMPDSWHRDSTAELYHERWQKALMSYRDIAAVPSAHELARECKAYLLRSASSAYSEIESMLSKQQPGSHWSENGPSMMNTLEDVFEVLKDSR